jgi:hypothetical protein
VKAKNETWSTHQWIDKPRQLETGSGDSVLHYHCVKCGRDFLTYTSSDNTHAVFVSALSFGQLSDAVTKRWLSEPCSGKHLSPNDEDRKKIIATILVSYRADLSLTVVEPHAKGPSVT